MDISKLSCLIDLHLHLDGAITPASAKKLAALQSIPLPPTDAELEQLLHVAPDCHSLNDFLKRFDFPCSLLMSYEGIRMAVVNLLAEVKAQGVMYAEIRFAPQKSVGKGLSQEQAILAAIEGIRASEIDANLIVCCMREKDNLTENLLSVELAAKYLGKGVCAADLAGAEALFPAKDYEEIFRYAQRLGVPYTIHAGEADGPESVRAALQLGASRIGHGVRAAEDDDLIKLLAETRVPLELCPTSNLCTEVFSDIREYPLRKLMDAGVNITINTDDPGIEDTTLPREYQLLIDAFKLTEQEVKALLIHSAKAAFASDALKEKLLNAIEAEFAKS